MSVVPAERDPLGAGGRRYPRLRPDRLDPLTAHHHDPPALGLSAATPSQHGVGRQHD